MKNDKEWSEGEQKTIDKINAAINELVYDKAQIAKAYNYYHGKRDPEQFRHLEENYGIGTPSSLEFVPLVRKHIDVLIGEYLSIPILPRVSCKDTKTLKQIEKDKKAKMNSSLIGEMKSLMLNLLRGEASTFGYEAKLNQIQSDIDENFISDFEIAAQNIVDWSMQNRCIDYKNKLKILLTDLLVAGIGYYKVSKSNDGNSINFRVLNPLYTYVDRNPHSPYMKHSARSVIKDYMTKDQILAEYGNHLTNDDIETLENSENSSMDNMSSTYIRSYDSVTASQPIMSDGILGGFEVTPLLPFERSTSHYFRLYPVYSVEWLQTDKENGKWIQNRYSGTRIGTNIFILNGKDTDVTRDMDDPNKCCLTVNGMFYSDRNGDPYSLVIKTANLQDKYDLLHFYRDNIIAQSGGVGSWVDMAHLPEFLGDSPEERLVKFIAYGKQGVKLFDTSQEGMAMNTTFNSYDETVKVNSIQAIDLAIQSIENECSMITGVFKEKLGGIEQRDAVSNVQVGVRQSTHITKQYYQMMDLMTRDSLLDILDSSKLVFKKGLTGTIILGENLKKTFIALPKHFTLSNFDIHIDDSSEIIKEQEMIRQLAMELTSGGAIEPDILVDLISSNSLTSMRKAVKESYKKKKEENDQTQQMAQQLEQANQQLEQTQSELQKLQQKIDSLNEEKLKIERDKLEFQKQHDWFVARDTSAYNQEKLEYEKERVKLEAVQLVDSNPKNDEIKNE